MEKQARKHGSVLMKMKSSSGLGRGPTSRRGIFQYRGGGEKYGNKKHQASAEIKWEVGRACARSLIKRLSNHGRSLRDYGRLEDALKRKGRGHFICY